MWVVYFYSLDTKKYYKKPIKPIKPIKQIKQNTYLPWWLL